jgi:hypothetical protein
LHISQLYPFKQFIDNIQVGLLLLISPCGKASTWAVSDKWPFLPSSQNRRGGVERGGIRYRKKNFEKLKEKDLSYFSNTFLSRGFLSVSCTFLVKGYSTVSDFNRTKASFLLCSKNENSLYLCVEGVGLFLILITDRGLRFHGKISSCYNLILYLRTLDPPYGS